MSNPSFGICTVYKCLYFVALNKMPLQARTTASLFCPQHDYTIKVFVQTVNYNHFLNVICCQFPHYFEHICVQRYEFVFNVLCIIFIAVAPSGYCISRVTIACRTVSEFVGVIVLCFYKQITSFSLDQANIWITLFCFLCVVLTTFGLL